VQKFYLLHLIPLTRLKVIYLYFIYIIYIAAKYLKLQQNRVISLHKPL